VPSGELQQRGAPVTRAPEVGDDDDERALPGRSRKPLEGVREGMARAAVPVRVLTVLQSEQEPHEARPALPRREDALGLAADDSRGMTVTGGLPYHGGPASGYLTHSIAAMVERLRADRQTAGIVSGVGMHMTKHVFGVYAAAPGPVEPPDADAAQRVADGAGRARVVAEHEGEATVGAYSVVHGRDGQPEWGLLVCDLADGTRTYAQVRDPALCLAAESTELVGTAVQLDTQTLTGPAGQQRVNLATW